MKKQQFAVLISAFLLGGAMAFTLMGSLRGNRVPVVTDARADETSEDPFAEAIKVQNAFRLISARVAESVVEITVQSENLVGQADSGELPWDDFFGDPSEESQGPRFFRSNGLGSGVIVERKGNDYFIVTNSHVIGNAEDIQIELNDGTMITGHLVGKDTRKDLALITVEYDEGRLPVAEFGNSDKIYVGDWVLAIGSPFGYEHSVSSGIVSALGRRDGPGDNINDFIQTDASINQGNSGGPLVNIRGEIIGINTFITTPNSGSIGLGFAIPANNVKSSVRQLIDYGEVRYGWLGVSLGGYGPEAADALGYPVRHGVMVYQVFDGSPADIAGIKAGDLILSLDGRRFVDHEQLIYRLGDKAPGDLAPFSVQRFGEKLELSAIMGEREGEEEVRAMHGLARPGFIPAPLTDDLRELMDLPDDIIGVPVAEVYPRTPAQAVDLRSGDIILSVNQEPIKGMPELYLALGRSEVDIPSFEVYRDGQKVALVQSKGVLP